MPRSYIPEFNGIVKGDDIKLSGERGQFRFVHLTTTADGKPDYCVIFGGTPGHAKMRCVDPARVIQVKQKAKRTKKESA